MPQFGAPLTGDSRNIIYNHNVFIIEAAEVEQPFFVLIFLALKSRFYQGTYRKEGKSIKKNKKNYKRK
jgi:hypothetical protein